MSADLILRMVPQLVQQWQADAGGGAIEEAEPVEEYGLAPKRRSTRAISSATRSRASARVVTSRNPPLRPSRRLSSRRASASEMTRAGSRPPNDRLLKMGECSFSRPATTVSRLIRVFRSRRTLFEMRASATHRARGLGTSRLKVRFSTARLRRLQRMVASRTPMR